MIPLLDPIRLAAPVLAAVSVSIPPSSETPPPDEAIELAVEDRVRRDGVLRLRPLEIDCQVGVVTLDGVVDHVLAKERAADLASTVRGVRSVVNGIVVDPHEERTDREIAEGVRQSLLADPATEAHDLKVSSLDGVVTLTGVVQSHTEEELSLAAARSVPGVTDVVDGIAVEQPQERPDAEIETEVRRALEHDVRVAESRLTVSVQDGSVTLTGAVPNLLAKERAERLAWARGAARVDASDVEVRTDGSLAREVPSPPESSEEIERAIEDALLFAPRVAPHEVEATVRNGIAYLRGLVDTYAARLAAERVALDTRGVRRVKNYVVVQPARDVPDAEIADRVELAFAADPWISEQEIDVRVRRGVVHLEGKLDTDATRRRAVDLASRLGGVRLVDERLTLRAPAGPRLRDAELEEDVEAELYWSPFVDSQKIEVDVTDGIVTLSGTARSWAEQRSAELNAREAGARMVRNRIAVEHAPGKAPFDEG